MATKIIASNSNYFSSFRAGSRIWLCYRRDGGPLPVLALNIAESFGPPGCLSANGVSACRSCPQRGGAEAAGRAQFLHETAPALNREPERSSWRARGEKNRTAFCIDLWAG
jgi:hypothetical protein